MVDRDAARVSKASGIPGCVSVSPDAAIRMKHLRESLATGNIMLHRRACTRLSVILKGAFGIAIELFGITGEESLATGVVMLECNCGKAYTTASARDGAVWRLKYLAG